MASNIPNVAFCPPMSVKKTNKLPLPAWANRGKQNGIVVTVRPPPPCHSEHLSVIPSAARNLKSLFARPASHCHENIPGQPPVGAFSLLVVSVATGMNDCCENRPRPPILGQPLWLPVLDTTPPHRHSRERTSPRTTIRGGNPISPPPGERYREGVFAIQLTETAVTECERTCRPRSC